MYHLKVTKQDHVNLAYFSPTISIFRDLTESIRPNCRNYVDFFFLTSNCDREEIANLVKRGEDFIATGDLAAARLVLQRAAEADDAQAALALAATYDPFVLRELKVYGFSGDVATARAWYEKAKEFGSAEAPRRLEILASGAR